MCESQIILPAYQAIQYIPVRGTIVSINCGTPTNVGSLYSGISVSGVSSIISYAGGNGGVYNTQAITSTGITGLTATLIAGNFANGSGTLTYTITGTPSASGTASFALNIGGQTCVLNLNVVNLVSQYPSGSVFCNGPTAIVDVTNPITGKTWMDRNLGAIQTETGSLDSDAYGDLYQWGRRSDGHQCRNSPGTTVLSSTPQPSHGFFITRPSIPPQDWLSPQNSNLWQGVNGINNPCPILYRIPTQAELQAEKLSWVTPDAAGALASPLRFPPLAGSRGTLSTGVPILNQGNGAIWSSTIRSILSNGTTFYYFKAMRINDGSIFDCQGSAGVTVRCIKDSSVIMGTIGSLNCSSTINSGTLSLGTAANGVSISVPYTGGNGGIYNGQTIASTGVTGLTATLLSGTLANGSGYLSYTITGTPNTIGMASFALNIVGQSCSINCSVAPAPTLVIGQSYQGGIIYYILQQGDPGYITGQTHGLIVSTTNQGSGIKWMNGNYTTTGATATAIGTGSSNTSIIIASQGNNGIYAAKLCRDYTGGGYTDWFLPSKEELSRLYGNRSLIGIFSSGYWCSSEFSNSVAWSQDFSNGITYAVFKDLVQDVRAVRKF
jgi:hypothetical protein